MAGRIANFADKNGFDGRLFGYFPRSLSNEPLSFGEGPVRPKPGRRCSSKEAASSYWPSAALLFLPRRRLFSGGRGINDSSRTSEFTQMIEALETPGQIHILVIEPVDHVSRKNFYVRARRSGLPPMRPANKVAL